MIRALQRSTRDTIARLGLARPAFWLYARAAQFNPKTLVGNRRFVPSGAPDGLPLPPADLIFLVAGTTDISWFLEGGARAAGSITEAMRVENVDMASISAMLDFGCGCGRVLRNWQALPHTEVHGTDYNERLVDWCRQNLPFARLALNGLKPPLAYEDGRFDLVYALSVFTHLTADLQSLWISELARTVRAGGHLVISTHGETYAHRLNAEERRRFMAGELVVKNDVKSPGSNTCSAYHPFSYVRDHLVRGLDIIAFTAKGAKGNPDQDLYVLRKP